VEGLRQRLCELIRTQALKRGQFVLSSGRVSSYYLDGRLITLSPEGAYLTGKVIFDLLKDSSVQAIGGPTLGADPMAAAVALVSHLEGRPMAAFIVRKEPKKHGRGRWVEGPLEPGMRVAILDDVITTGESLLRAIEAVKQEGCIVEKVIVLVDREEGGREVLAAQGYELTAIFNLLDLGIN